MATRKGAELEELVRAYFARQGFFALRSVFLRFEDEGVTDIDVWSYGRQSASVRTRTLVDVKDKRSPKAFERILWARGMQLALGCDRAIVATTDANPKVAKFAQQQKVALLSKDFLHRLQGKIDTSDRLTLEQFFDNIRRYPDHKQDCDWIGQISDAKSAVISLQGYPAFNKSMAVFRFFAERSQTRPQHKEQAIRAAYFVAALACVALDAALEHVLYEDSKSRYRAIAAGVTYGDAGDAKVQKSVESVLLVIAEGMDNGRVVARQAEQALRKMFENVRADIIAEHFSKEHNAGMLVNVAKELDDRAHCVEPSKVQTLSPEAKSVIGVFSDFVQVKRVALFDGRPAEAPEQRAATSDTRAARDGSDAAASEEASTDKPHEHPSKLL